MHILVRIAHSNVITESNDCCNSLLKSKRPFEIKILTPAVKSCVSYARRPAVSTRSALSHRRALWCEVCLTRAFGLYCAISGFLIVCVFSHWTGGPRSARVLQWNVIQDKWRSWWRGLAHCGAVLHVEVARRVPLRFDVHSGFVRTRSRDRTCVQ